MLPQSPLCLGNDVTFYSYYAYKCWVLYYGLKDQLAATHEESREKKAHSFPQLDKVLHISGSGSWAYSSSESICGYQRTLFSCLH